MSLDDSEFGGGASQTDLPGCFFFFQPPPVFLLTRKYQRIFPSILFFAVYRGRMYVCVMKTPRR